MRAVGAEFRAASTGKNREDATERSDAERQANARLHWRANEIPSREWKDVEIGQRGTVDNAGERRAVRQVRERGFGFAANDEVAVLGKEVGHLRRREPDEADPY